MNIDPLHVIYWSLMTKENLCVCVWLTKHIDTKWPAVDEDATITKTLNHPK